MAEAHLVSLSSRHAILDGQIMQEVQRPMPDTIAIAQWKKEKLRLKDAMGRSH